MIQHQLLPERQGEGRERGREREKETIKGEVMMMMITLVAVSYPLFAHVMTRIDKY